MTAASFLVQFAVFFIVALTDFMRWRENKSAPLTEMILATFIVVRFSLKRETRAEFKRVMHASSFVEAAKAYLMR